MPDWTYTWDYALAMVILYSVAFIYSTSLILCHLYLIRSNLKALARKKAAKLNIDAKRGNPSGRNANLTITISTAQRTFTPQRNTGVSDNRSCFGSSKLHKNILLYGLIISLSSYWAMCVIGILYRLLDLNLFGTSVTGCNDYILVLSFLWSLAKGSMYLVFTARVQGAYQSSRYAWPKQVINTLYLSLVVCYSGVLAGMPFFSGGTTESMTGRKSTNKMSICVNTINPAWSGTLAFLDVCWSVLLLWLFIRPLQLLFADQKPMNSIVNNQPSNKIGGTGGGSKSNTNNTSQSKSGSNSRSKGYRRPVKHAEMKVLPLKYLVTTSVAVFSTIISLVLMAVTNAGFLVICDAAFINISCLIIMSRHWKRLYWLMCSPLMKLILLASCLDAHHSDSLVRVIEYYTTQNKSPMKMCDECCGLIGKWSQNESGDSEESDAGNQSPQQHSANEMDEDPDLTVLDGMEDTISTRPTHLTMASLTPTSPMSI